MNADRLQEYLLEMEDHPSFGYLTPPITVRSENGCGDTPLHVAVRRGDFEIVCDMLEAGADIDKSGEESFTPLHYAIMFDDVAMVRLLLDRGARIETMSGWGETPLESATRRGIAEIITAIQARVA
ncbi:MAG: ankyrin repeat and protein kinase protein 1-like [Chthoniobacteraceae bacterium]|nr:ankyrin repeat and protein kinase protein 1-like [Chthoniobacteraceae bacterium]